MSFTLNSQLGKLLHWQLLEHIYPFVILHVIEQEIETSFGWRSDGVHRFSHVTIYSCVA